MKLIVFDIDGTITDSTEVDDECFIQSFQDLFSITLADVNWNEFGHVTDSGLMFEIFQIYFSRPPSEQEISEVKGYFYQLLSRRCAEINEVKGARKTLKYLVNHPEIAVAFATGGWKETALLKLSAIGFELDHLTLVSSDEHYDRSVITKRAIDKSREKSNQQIFDSITYIGDGLWDFKTAKQLRINFIGIDYHQNNKLARAGATRILPDLTDVVQILEWI